MDKEIESQIRRLESGFSEEQLDKDLERSGGNDSVKAANIFDSKKKKKKAS